MNKKLTKAQRHIAYIIMREIIASELFFCNAGKEIGIFKPKKDVSDSTFEEMLPELYAKKPIENYTENCWFSCQRKDTNKRIELLNQCIIETYETNLTPSEIAEIRLKAESGKAPVEYNFNESVAYEIGYTEGYTTAACEDAAEIKRLREGIDQGCKYWSISSDVRNHFKELLNNQP